MNDLPAGQAFALATAGFYEIRGNEIVATAITGGFRLTMLAPLRLSADASYDVRYAGGPIDVGAHRLALSFAALSGPISGTGELELRGGFCCDTTISGTHAFSGAVSGSIVLVSQGAVLPASLSLSGLRGTGTFGPVTVSGVINGSLTTGPLKVMPGTFFGAQPANPTVRVNGSVDITGAVLSRQGGSATQGQVFTIIQNDGTDPVIGTFRDLPEGAALDKGPERFIVSYVGGDGNDVTLTTVRALKHWKGGGGDTLWSNPANWDGGVPPVSGDSVRFGYPAGAVVNDIPGLSLHSLIADFANDFLITYPRVFISGEPIGITSRLYLPSMHTRVRALADGVVLGGWFYHGIDVGPHAIEVSGRIAAATPDRGVTGTGRISYGGAYYDAMGGPSISGIHSFAGTMTIDGEYANLSFSGEMPAEFRVARNQLSGGGLVGALTITGTGKLAPSPFLDARGLSMASGTTLTLPSLDEPLDIAGTVALGSPTLDLPRMKYRVGHPYVVIRNDGTDAISGAFANLPEGGTVKSVDNFDFRASYVGGDGNDFTLTALNGKAVPSDFNRDRKADIVWHHRGGNGNPGLGLVHRMDMDGFAITSQETIYSEPDFAWRPVARGDFDANGATDLLWRNMATGDVYVMLFDPQGRPMGGAVVHREPDLIWKIVGAPDLDGDGRADILWARSNSVPTMYAHLMDGTTIRERGQVYMGNGAVGAVEISAIGDFDGDGRDELIVRHANGAVHRVVFHRAHYVVLFEGLSQSFYTEPDANWRIVAAPDLDGDGVADLLWQNVATGQAYGMLTHPYAFGIWGRGHIHTPESTSWVIATTGDYDGDGKEDILWHNEADGRVHVMLMNGIAIKEQRTIYREPDTGWKPVGPRSFATP